MVLASRRRALGALFSGATGAALGTGAPSTAPAPERWLWAGALGPRSATVKARFAGDAATVTLLLDTTTDLPHPRSLPPTTRVPLPGGGEVASFALEGLEPGRTYAYAIERSGLRGRAGSFRTPHEGPQSFTAAFASCASSGSNSSIFSTIEQRNPLFMIHMGDFHYRNIKVNDPVKFVEAFDEVLTAPRQASLYRHVPLVYMWDDHDYGDDDSDATCPSRPAARAMYDACVPHYGFESTGPGTIQQAFSIGRVRFLVTDNRSARTPARTPDSIDKSMLGRDQRDWFDDQLRRAASTVPLVVWVNSVPWITKSAVTSVHGWQPWSAERRWLADRIKAHGLARRLIILSGDAHMVALDDGSNSNYASDAAPGEASIVVAHAAPLDRYPRRKGGPYTHGPSTKRNQFGLFSVEDDGATMRVEITGHVKDGTALPGMRLRLSVEADGYHVDRSSTGETSGR